MNRDEMIRAEAERQAEYERRRQELKEEFDAIAGPVLEFRRIEQRMRAIQNELAVLRDANSAAHAQWQRDLENAIPLKLRVQLQHARMELGQRHSDPPAETLARLAALRAWVDQVEAARRDPGVTLSDLEQFIARGDELILTGPPRAFHDPKRVNAA